MLRFHEYVERSTQAKKAAHLLFLLGEDTALKEVVIEHLGALTGLGVSRERFEIKDIRSVVGLWEEGSLMGPRFLDLHVKAKPKNNKLWKTFLAGISLSENYMTVSFEKEEPDWAGGILSRPIFQVVDCKFPRRNKERTKLANLRLKMQGCVIEPAMVKELAGRVKSAAELESAVITLTLLAKTCKITEREITYVAGEAEQFSNTVRAILLGNNLVLLSEIEGLEPLLLLSSWYAAFKKLYCWMSQLTGEEEEKKEHEDESEEDEDETPEEIQGLKVSKYQLRDYNVAKKRYSQPLIREIMEDINGVYQDIRIGRKDGWKERARFIVSKMPTK